MNIKLSINDHEHILITKSNNFGYNVEHIYPTINPRTKEPSTGSKVYFYARMSQVAEKLVWLGLEGSGMDELVDNMVILTNRMTEALEKRQ